jgi:hypothetical protein
VCVSQFSETALFEQLASGTHVDEFALGEAVDARVEAEALSGALNQSGNIFMVPKKSYDPDNKEVRIFSLVYWFIGLLVYCLFSALNRSRFCFGFGFDFSFGFGGGFLLLYIFFVGFFWFWFSFSVLFSEWNRNRFCILN